MRRNVIIYLMPTQVELKVKAAENRFEEEKLKIQKSHEEALKQVYLTILLTRT